MLWNSIPFWWQCWAEGNAENSHDEGVGDGDDDTGGGGENEDDDDGDYEDVDGGVDGDDDAGGEENEDEDDTAVHWGWEKVRQCELEEKWKWNWTISWRKIIFFMFVSNLDFRKILTALWFCLGRLNPSRASGPSM